MLDVELIPYAFWTSRTDRPRGAPCRAWAPTAFTAFAAPPSSRRCTCSAPSLLAIARHRGWIATLSPEW